MDTLTAPTKREILACVEQGVDRRREGDVEELVALLAWADAHSGDPQAEPGAVPVVQGGPRLVTIGGEGTPGVNDLCFAELAIARQAGEVATQHAVADALDLRHRLPLTWAGVQGLACEVWVARKVARLSRSLSREAVQVVDVAVAAALHESPGRIIALAEAKVIEADRVAHAERIETNRTRRGVWLSRPRPGELVEDIEPTAGIRIFTARLEEADALELDETLQEIADLLAIHADPGPVDPPTADQLRADALAMLGRPADALALLAGDDGEVSTGSTNTNETPRRAVLHVHLSSEAGGVARVEELGPRLLTELQALLRRRDLTVQPVIDLNRVHRVNGYEHPTAVRRRTELRVHGDAFPHTTVSTSSTTGSRRIDHDHPTPYDRDGPPGQTGDHNDAPLTRRHHRAKTHTGYRVDQLALAAYRWRTPQGLARVVTPSGTRRVDLITDAAGEPIGEIYDGPALTFGY